MKNTQQKRSIITWAKQRLLLLLTLLCLSQGSFAQLMPPNAAFNEYPYPGPWGPGAGINTHCYSRPGWWGCMPGGTNTWLLVNSWEFGGVAGFAWQAMDFVTNAAYDQGFIILPAGATDLNVGIIAGGPTGQQVDVSYYLAAGAASGHYVNVYNWGCPAIWGGLNPGCALAFTLQLSCIPVYTRISMDSHLGYGTAIVWEDPTAGTNEIHVIGANMNNFGPPQRIAGTVGHTVPEVAFVHVIGPLDIHIASFDPAMGNIEEYQVAWPAIIPGGANACPPPGLCNACPALLPRILNDVNAVGAATPRSLHIDAPDHYATANWAYTWELGGDIFARINNPNLPPWAAPAMAGIATVCFTNGFYVAPFYPMCCPMPVINPTVGDMNTVPVICWDNVPVLIGGLVNQQSFYVAWQTTFNDAAYNPASNAYIAIQVNEDGLIRNPMPMPFNWFGATMVPANISPAPSVALSECNETAMLYGTFVENTTANYNQHRWVPWNVGSFKPGHGTPLLEERFEIKINPNPFKDKLAVDFPHEIEGEMVTMVVTDMMGREYGKYQSIVYGANDFLNGIAGKLTPGNYNISVECNRIKFQKVFKVTKLD